MAFYIVLSVTLAPVKWLVKNNLNFEVLFKCTSPSIRHVIYDHEEILRIPFRIFRQMEQAFTIGTV